ncbi:hypothetical protein BH11MYX1_BH11MYX1_57090 [soil metagenome]
MKLKRWLAALAVVTGCGFGDNNVTRGTTHHRCGDGLVDPGEGCDDGNNASGDGCSASCTVETQVAACGNHVLENAEECDDGNTTSGDGCSATCKHESLCGNHVVEAGEQCDDGNTASGDGCSPTCQTEAVTACALLPQSGCSGATPACDLTAADDGSTACRAVTVQGTSNNHCSVDTGCKAGYTCVHDANATDTPWCARFCAADSDCLGTGSRCVDDLGGTNVVTCSNACDPYGQSGCPTGMGCMGYEATGGDFTDCIYQGAVPQAGACTTDHDCEDGLACVSHGSQKTCQPYCVVGNSNTCFANEICAAFVHPLVIGTVEYGACF